MWHPWRTLRHQTHVTLRWATDLPAGILGHTHHLTQTITLLEGLTQAERRCTLTHELLHIARGVVPAWLQPREEEAVDREAARLLITIDALVDGLAWARDEHELAEELWVDVPTVRARLAGLTAEERRLISDRLDQGEENHQWT